MYLKSLDQLIIVIRLIHNINEISYARVPEKVESSKTPKWKLLKSVKTSSAPALATVPEKVESSKPPKWKLLKSVKASSEPPLATALQELTSKIGT